MGSYDDFVASCEREILAKQRFKEMGKENDLPFQALAFLGRGAEQLSLASTVLTDSEVPNVLKEEIKNIQRQLDHVAVSLRQLKNK